MSQVRKTPIYGNCQVYGPDGKLMFRCLKKRADWYLSRKLAVILKENPLSIKLTFTPKGKGESMEILKLERKNQCVICGTKDLNILTKHHLVPFVYRQYFPNKNKAHSSLFVLPICRECHYDYENKFANQLKKELSEIYSAPFNNNVNVEKNRVLGVIRSFKKFKDKIPKDRQQYLIEQVKQDLTDMGIYNDEDLTNISILENIELKLDESPKSQVIYSHGKTVVEQIKDIGEFEKMWAKHFVDNMKPKYMPKYFLTALNNSASRPN